MTRLDIDRRHIWHPYASMCNPPPVELAVSASGTRIRLADGQELIDGVSSWWCMAHGHCPAPVTEAVRRQAEALPQVMFAGFTHEPAIRLTEALLAVLPPNLNHVFYADSGSIAVEVATKMALQYQHAKGRPERRRLAALRGGYHGDTAGAMALSDPDGMHTMFRGMLPEHVFAERPVCRFADRWEDRFFDATQALLATHAADVAAVICEPVFQGANGMWMYHPGYLKALRNFCSAHDILLIFDEIATGFYRTGPRFAMEYAGVSPDIVCLGKSLTGGVIGLAATVASDMVADAVASDRFCGGALIHGPTFMANPLACAAGAASLAMFAHADYAAKASRIEATLRTGLEPFRALENVRDVRTLGAIGVLEVNRIPSPERVHEVVRQTGVWLRPYGNFIYTMPPFITPENELNRIVETMGILANG